MDDCSTDEPVRKLSRSHGASYMRPSVRLGPAAARNLGADHARGCVLVFVDADVAVSPEPCRPSPPTSNEIQNWPQFSDRTILRHRSQGFFSQYKNLIHHYIHQNANPRAGTFWAGCGAIRAEIFQRFRFDENKYPRPSIEDIELGLRLQRAGQKILLDKRIQATHLKRWTFAGMLKSDIRDRAIPWSNLILETGEMPADLNLGYKSRLSAAVAMLLAALRCSCRYQCDSEKRRCSGPPSASAAGIGVLIAMNHALYRFFEKKRGLFS